MAYLGVSSGGFAGGEMWLAGTGGGTPIDLIDDGAWHHYTLTFQSTIGQSLRLKLEDFDGSGGVAGDVYFDNVRITSAVPEPFGGDGAGGFDRSGCGASPRQPRLRLSQSRPDSSLSSWNQAEKGPSMTALFYFR